MESSNFLGNNFPCKASARCQEGIYQKRAMYRMGFAHDACKHFGNTDDGALSWVLKLTEILPRAKGRILSHPHAKPQGQQAPPRQC
jgi:hypothetical protein